MSVLKVLGAALATTLLVSTSALALTITNRDAAPHTVMIQKGDSEGEIAVPAGEAVDAACEDSCVVSLAGSEDKFEAQDADKLFVQDGALQREQ